MKLSCSCDYLILLSVVNLTIEDFLNIISLRAYHLVLQHTIPLYQGKERKRRHFVINFQTHNHRWYTENPFNEFFFFFFFRQVCQIAAFSDLMLTRLHEYFIKLSSILKFYHFLAYTNPTSLMDAMLHTTILCLSVF